MGKRRTRLDDRQGELFADARALYPLNVPAGVVTASDFKLRLAQAISEALHESGKSRTQIAWAMTESLGEPISEHMLNAYASPAREGHDITVTRLRALVQATGCLWLWEVATEGQGLTLMAGQDAIYAQRGLIRRQIEELQQREKQLAQAMPVHPATQGMIRGRK